jgi:hypothetical protein
MFIGQPNFPMLSADQANPAISGLARMIQMHLQRQQVQRNDATMPFVGPQAQANLQRTQLGNQGAEAQLPYIAPEAAADLQGKQLQNKFYAPNMQSQIASRDAGTLQQNIMNSLLPDKMKSDIGLTNAQAQMYGMGGGMHPTAAIQSYNQVLNNVAQDNPELKNDPSKIREATNAYLQNQNSLSDGTQLNPMSGVTQQSLGQYVKYSTTAPLLTRQVGAQQAEAEQNVISNLAKKYILPYGNTYDGYSPQQIVDSFKSDPESQKRLGQFIAGQQMMYDMSQLQIRINQGQSSEGATNDILNSSQMRLKAQYPKLSAEARSNYLDAINDAMKQMLSARQKQGINASQTVTGQAEGTDSKPSKESSGDSDPLGLRG